VFAGVRSQGIAEKSIQRVREFRFDLLAFKLSGFKLSAPLKQLPAKFNAISLYDILKHRPGRI
jgi:hypothetical protein